MNAISPQPQLTREEYLEAEKQSGIRHEFVGGRLYAMAGGSRNHAAVIYRLHGITYAALAGRDCEGTGNDQRVRIENTDNFLYPDLVIMCPPHRFDEQDPESLLNPRVVFEVLSPSTESRDRTIKFDLLKTIPEFTDYVLVFCDRVRVEHFRRLSNREWVQLTYVGRHETVSLDNVGISISMDALYQGLAVPEGMILVEPTE